MNNPAMDSRAVITKLLNATFFKSMSITDKYSSLSTGMPPVKNELIQIYMKYKK